MPKEITIGQEVKIELNLNATVRAKVTPSGLLVWRKYIDSFWLETPRLKKPMAQEFYVGPLWECSQIFGPAMAMGCNPPIETQLEILSNDFKIL